MEKPYVDPSYKMASCCLGSSTINIDKEEKTMPKNSSEKNHPNPSPLKLLTNVKLQEIICMSILEEDAAL